MQKESKIYYKTHNIVKLSKVQIWGPCVSRFQSKKLLFKFHMLAYILYETW